MKNPTATTWLISFEQIRLREPLVADYMAPMSCVCQQDIPKGILPLAPDIKKTANHLEIVHEQLTNLLYCGSQLAQSYRKRLS
jgi:hypothetical protein